jgi:hypothetical protein
MSIRLSIEITSPLGDDDRDLLSGIAVMTLAIANHEMAKNAFPETFGDEPDAQAATPNQPVPCALLDARDATRICIAEAGHRGRHRFRTMAAGDADSAAPRAN